MFRRTILILWEVIFKGCYKNRRKEASEIFEGLFQDINIENLNVLSRKQTFIPYNRIKIDVTLLIYSSNIRTLIHCGNVRDIFIILVNSGN